MSLKDPSLLRQAALVGTRWIEADGSGIAVKNPATGELVGYVPKLGAKETKEAIDASAASHRETASSIGSAVGNGHDAKCRSGVTAARATWRRQSRLTLPPDRILTRRSSSTTPTPTWSAQDMAS